MAGNLQEKEKRIAEESFGSASPYDQVAAIMGLPDDVAGLRIVDIGSGTSTAVAELCERGAIASGINPGYFRVNRLVRSVERYLRKDQQEGNIGKFRRGMATLQGFEGDYQRNKTRYIAAYAGEFPIDDNSVDIAYSMLAVSHFLSADRDVLIGAVDEALRVLKPAEEGVPKERRSLILQPWLSGSAINPIKRQNSIALEASLRERGIPFFVESIDPGVSPRLRIIKP